MTETTEQQDDREIQEGDRVQVTLKPEGDKPGEVVIGVVEVAIEQGLLVKPKGSPRARLFRADSILETEILDEEDEKLKPTVVKPVTPDTVKRHLLNYHGQPLSEVNGYSTQRALAAHDDLHRIHKNEVGHRHAEPKSGGDNDGES